MNPAKALADSAQNLLYAIPKGCSIMLKSSEFYYAQPKFHYPYTNVLIQHIKPCLELRHSI